MNMPLKGLKVIDLSHRLPGPLCGKILADLGAEVIKIEDHIFKDPFLSGLFSEFDQSFTLWYENLNKNKNIHRYDFNNNEDQKKISEEVKSADIVIMGLPYSARKKLNITDEDLKLNKPFIVIELLASKTEQKSMHDLNALAMSGLLKLITNEEKRNIVAPPFLPIAGISFGHKAATDILANYIEAQGNKKTVFVKTYLDEVTNEILGIFWPSEDRKNDRTKFLHNGQYPCYALYKLKDGNYAALAAVEEKFWNRFTEIFKINPVKDRFYHQDDSLFEQISKTLLNYNTADVEALIKDEDVCLSLIK